jgi:hypothetical protein
MTTKTDESVKIELPDEDAVDGFMRTRLPERSRRETDSKRPKIEVVPLKAIPKALLKKAARKKPTKLVG